MSIRHAILPFVLTVGVTPVFAAGSGHSHAYVPPASFLNYHVSTVRELSQEVTLDPAVRARLANHFHVSEAQITQYVRRNLVLTHLQKPGRYSVACVGSDGQEFWVETRLPKGTAVFASRATGQPILRLACGNPMVPSLPPVPQTTDNNGNNKPAQFAYLAPPVPIDAEPMPGLMPGDDIPAPLLVASTDVTPTVVEVSPSLQSLIPSLPLGSASRSFNFLPALLGAVAVTVASTGHGSTSNVTPAPGVPEASTSVSLAVMLLLGAGGMFVFRRKRAPEKAN